ncbi:MAG: hypothetical protein WAX33_00630 [Rectinemataceae bacterium]
MESWARWNHLERFEDSGCRIDRVVNCGGIAMEISRSSQTGALGSAMAAAVVAGSAHGGYSGFQEATRRMTGVSGVRYIPDSTRFATYDRLSRCITVSTTLLAGKAHPPIFSPA